MIISRLENSCLVALFCLTGAAELPGRYFRGDRLSLAYNTFFSDLEVDPPAERRLSFRFVVTQKGDPEGGRGLRSSWD